jgi:hypothetical protein
VRLQADPTSIACAGREIEDLARGLQRTVHAASDLLKQAESDIGDRVLGVALRNLGHSLARAEQQSVRALGAFGEQVQLTAQSYQQADLDLTRLVHIAPR